MDKRWMNQPRQTDEYMTGVDMFLEFAFSNSAKGNKILCPCKICQNSCWRVRDVVREHLICDGFAEGYRTWVNHGEPSSSVFPNSMQYDSVEVESSNEEDDITDLHQDLANGLDDMGDLEVNEGQQKEDMETFFKLLDDAGKELYPGCRNFSKLRFMVRLLHIKFLGGWSNKSFDMLLDLLKDVLPDGSSLPKNFNAAKNTVKYLGLGYTNIHACENDCVLFWKQHEHLNFCPRCNTSRWKSEKTSPNGKRVHRVPMKVLRYFPIKKRLQRYFMSSKTAADARWHDEGRTKDGLLRHPADAPFWKDFDSRYPDFAADSRNLRLAVAADGFSPYRTMSLNYSIWPVILIPYNVPPWKCMKQTNFILSLLIPGRKAAASDMDVYLEPLIDDMIDMFVHGVRTYDASKGECFQLRAAILCTITDLPGLGHLLSCSVSGKLACPECHSDICSVQLKKGGKYVYMGHRRFLDADHIFRSNADSFDGTVENRTAPTPLSGEEIFKLTENIEWTFGKDPVTKKPIKQPRKDSNSPQIVWKRCSIWFKLPYWKYLMLQHNFDVMHIEKNICDFIINTLLEIDGKSKDNLNARMDMQKFGIRNNLHPIEVDDRFYLPPALYNMSPDEKKLFCQILKGVKFPDGYASDISRNVIVEEKRIIGQKSHDNHVLLQDLLPHVVRNILPTQTTAALIRVSNFFKQIYSPAFHVRDMEKLEAEIAETLSILETIFPPAFFDMMVHLMVHLPTQARIAGPVQYRSMWPVERFLMRCKGYVRTKSHPEGSICEGHKFDESLTFCSQFLNGCETRFTRQARNGEPIENESSNTTPFFRSNGKALSGKCTTSLDYKTWLQAHRYVLSNYDKIEPYLNKHIEYLSSAGHRNQREINRIHHEMFHEWFRKHVEGLIENGAEVSEEIQILASEPFMIATMYSSYTINGFNFHTHSYDEGRPFQSSGVALVAQTSCFEDGNVNPVVRNKTYYGIIKEIIELNYRNKGSIVLFKCDWVDNRVLGRWVKTDQFGITSVNVKHLFNTGERLLDEPFIFASQAMQVYYVPDPIHKDWSGVVQSKPRHLYDMAVVDDENEQQEIGIRHWRPDLHTNVDLNVFLSGVHVRTDIDGIIVNEKKEEEKQWSSW